MIITKKAGRPKKLEREDVLLRAIDVFWKKGFDGASVKDLTDAIGVKSPSLYADFGDKRGLYLASIELYISNGACAPLVAFESEPDIYNAVRAFLVAAIDHASDCGDGLSGCFLASSVATSVGNVEGANELLQQAIAKTDKRIAERFEREVELNKLPSDFPSLARARLMFDLRQGLVFRARAGAQRDTLLEGLDEKVAMLLS
ncbi:TetR/AcrR family transcriptional regulator [Aliagarivorans marinus]|uniref:TetR/AcrR family transcriptional regulator n=1 Tax=Aliagarivorans marinus TaxID=561965 RepID=UPI000479DBA7|nr:TetR/AcrR family transcriptional regulator [Aliagarivorans marinus]